MNVSLAKITSVSAIDRHTYEPGTKVSDKQMASLKIRFDKFHGDWNYTILPNVT